MILFSNWIFRQANKKDQGIPAPTDLTLYDKDGLTIGHTFYLAGYLGSDFYNPDPDGLSVGHSFYQDGTIIVDNKNLYDIDGLSVGHGWYQDGTLTLVNPFTELASYTPDDLPNRRHTTIGTLTLDPFGGSGSGVTIFIHGLKVDRLGDLTNNNGRLTGFYTEGVDPAYGFLTHGAVDTWDCLLTLIGHGASTDVVGFNPPSWTPAFPDLRSTVTNGDTLTICLQIPKNGNVTIQYKVNGGAKSSYTYSTGATCPSSSSLIAFVNKNGASSICQMPHYVIKYLSGGANDIDTAYTYYVTGIGGGFPGNIVWQDTFVQYANVAAYTAEVDGRYSAFNGTSMFALDTGVVYSGHNTLRLDFPASTSGAPESYVDLPYPLSNCWIFNKLRFKPGFTTTGVGGAGSQAYKILGWGWVGFDGRGTLDYTNTNQYQVSWDVRDSGTGVPIGPFTNSATQGYTWTVVNEWTDGLWYNIMIHFFTNNTLNVTQTMYFWKDGDPLPTAAPKLINTGTSSAVTVPKTSSVNFGQNYNQARGVGQDYAINHAERRIWDGSKNADPMGLL